MTFYEPPDYSVDPEVGSGHRYGTIGAIAIVLLFGAVLFAIMIRSDRQKERVITLPSGEQVHIVGDSVRIDTTRK